MQVGGETNQQNNTIKACHQQLATVPKSEAQGRKNYQQGGRQRLMFQQLPKSNSNLERESADGNLKAVVTELDFSRDAH